MLSSRHHPCLIRVLTLRTTLSPFRVNYSAQGNINFDYYTKMRCVGLTGGIACGKSTVVNVLREEGIAIIDCDKISRDIFQIGWPAYNQVVKEFGRDILMDDGTIDRKKLGALIFETPALRRKLGSITGMPIMKEILKKLVYHWLVGTSVVVIDAPILYESKRLLTICARVIVVASDEDLQIKRMASRDGLSESEARSRINAQMPVADKVALADETLWNNGTTMDSINAHAHILATDLKNRYCGLSMLWSGPGVAAVALATAVTLFVFLK